MTSLDYQWLSVVARRLKVLIKGFLVGPHLKSIELETFRFEISLVSIKDK